MTALKGQGHRIPLLRDCELSGLENGRFALNSREAPVCEGYKSALTYRFPPIVLRMLDVPAHLTLPLVTQFGTSNSPECTGTPSSDRF
jgi:hypothetical protein